MRRGALKRELLIVATGDHNLRMSYAGGYAHHLHGVPILIWAPESLEADAGKVDVTRWAGHRDIFPTLSLIHISEPTRRTPISYAVFCLKKKKKRDEVKDCLL